VSTQIQYRRGTAVQNNAFTGVLGEITVDTTNKTLRVHDGTTVGGANIATVAYVSAQLASLSANKINQNASNVTVDSSFVNVAVNGTNVAAFSSQSLSLTGFLNVSGNVLGSTASFGAINSTGFINTTANVSAAVYTGGAISITGLINTLGNIICSVLDAGSIECTGIVYANSTAQSTSTTTGALEVLGGVGIVGNLNVGDGTLSGGTHKFQGNIVPFSSNTYTLGTNTAWWTIAYSKAVQAQYADLAENYTSDSDYAPGTVLVFGGEAEVTQSTASHDPRIAGIVSTNPAYLMNGAVPGIPVALQGRVPCQVLGPVAKGDRLVASQHPGIAQRLNKDLYEPGCIIGKALQAIETTTISTIEVVVGRL
jgi:hypothetical protein